MTDSTARSLASKEAVAQGVQIRFDALEAAMESNRSHYEKRLAQLEKELDEAPRPLLENPWFWVSVVGAGVGAFYLGTRVTID